MTALTKPLDMAKEIGIDAAPWTDLIAGLILLGFLCTAIYWILRLYRLVAKFVAEKRRSPEEVARAHRRALFAQHVESSIRAIDIKEDWAEHRFTDLEAEIEVSSESSTRLSWLSSLRPKDVVRREESLTKAIREGSDPVVLLQGDPGSGKSVALRYVARAMSRDASASSSLDSVIPIYVNLKSFIPVGDQVSAEDVNQFIVSSLTAIADRDVHSFLDGEFARGKEDGTWLFLFDSFDEIPAVLSSTEFDDAIDAYSSAIYAFMASMNSCKAVVASREFRSPRSEGLPKFRIVPLSESRKSLLIERQNLSPQDARLVQELSTASPDVVALSSNPLFLSLLCDYTRVNHRLPSGWHDVFETYVETRLSQDDRKIQSLFGLNRIQVRRQTEHLAFTMTASRGIGLNPTRSSLRVAMAELGFETRDLDSVLDAIEFTKIGKGEETAGQARTFTFAHRRFQEFFATNVVLDEPRLVPPETLVSDLSWRETAVTLIQSQPDLRQSVLKAAEDRLVADTENFANEAEPTVWAGGSLHILDLLQSGFAGSDATPNASLSAVTDAVLQRVRTSGDLLDRKWALEVAAAGSPETQMNLLEDAFDDRSQWLQEVAFRQLGRLGIIPTDLAIRVRWAMFQESLKATGHDDWQRLRAHALRLRPQRPFASAAKMFEVSQRLDVVFLILAAIAVALLYGLTASKTWFAMALALVTFVLTAFALKSLPRSRLRPRNRSELEDPTTETSALDTEIHSRVARIYRNLKLDRYQTGSSFWISGAITLALYSRAFLVLLPVTGADIELLAIIASAVLALLLTWRFATIAVAVIQPISHPIFWPFSHFALLAIGLVKVAKKSAVELLTAIVALVIFVALLIGMGLLMEGSEIVQKIVIGFGVVGMIVVATTTLPAVLRSMFEEVSDRVRLWSWLRIEHERVTTDEFLSDLRTFRSASVAARFVRYVRTEQILDADETSEIKVRKFLSRIATDTEQYLSNTNKNDGQRRPTSSRGSNDPSLVAFRFYVPDELGKLLEEVSGNTERPTA